MAVTTAEEVEASTAAAGMGVAAFTVVDSAAATMVGVTATAAGEWVRDTAVADMEGCAADIRRAVLGAEEVGRRVGVLRADGRDGVEIEGTSHARLPTGNGIRSVLPGAESRLLEWAASADRLIGAEAITADAAVSAGAAGMDIGATAGEVVGAVAGGLASA